jgi:hypothetical protein
MMLTIFDREIEKARQRLLVLAPPQANVPLELETVTYDPDEHRALLGDVQRLRGGVYLRDGAVTAKQLTSDGRHETAEDRDAWHVVVLDDARRVQGCIWYREHASFPAFEDLRACQTPLASRPEWRIPLKVAIHSEVERARREQVRYAEVGGWAVECGSHCVSAALLLVLGTFGLSQTIGGALVIATATVRHSSAKILRRLGGAPLEANGITIPGYYDERYGCEMELLRFDTRRPSAKYAPVVNRLKRELSEVEILSAQTPSMASAFAFNPVGAPRFAAVPAF